MMKAKTRTAIAVALTMMCGARADMVEWTFPRMGSCHEGLAFSDGVTGVLVWGGERTINVTVGRGDLWDHRGGYPWTVEQNYTNIVAAVESGDTNRLWNLFKKEPLRGEPYNPYMLPLGRVVVMLKGDVALARGELDPFTGIGGIVLSDGRKIGLAMSRKSRTFVMDVSSVDVCSVATKHCMEYPVVQKALMPLGFKPAKVLRKTDMGGFTWELPGDDSVSLAWSTGCVGEIAITTSRGGMAAPCARYDIVKAESLAEWTAYWSEGARVKVPDPVLQREFDYGMYRFGAMTSPDGVPAGLQGQWLEDDRLVPWNGDYHFNINVQECYSPAYRGGHFSHLLPLFRMVLSWRPRLSDNAKKFVGIDNGYVLPHSVDDRGVCIGGFWTGTIDHASTAWMASLMFRYVKYSRDLAFLKSDVYDFMKGAMNVYRAMMEDKDGRLSFPLGPSPEWGGAEPKSAVGRDPSFQLAACHRLAQDLIAAAKMLGEKPDWVWLDVEKRLPPYNLINGRIALFGTQELTESHRHHSHMAGFYPFDTIDMNDEETKKVAWETYYRWVEKGTGYWTGWCVPWASILNTHVGNAAAAVGLLRAWEAYFTNPGHGSLHNAYEPGFSVWTTKGSFEGSGAGDVMQMDGQCAAATAVMELLVHEVNGRVEYFRGCPESWKDVSFDNIALSDGTRVSARRLNGVVTVTAPAKTSASSTPPTGNR